MFAVWVLAEAVNNLLITVNNLPGSFVIALNNNSLYINVEFWNFVAWPLSTQLLTGITF